MKTKKNPAKFLGAKVLSPMEADRLVGGKMMHQQQQQQQQQQQVIKAPDTPTPPTPPRIN